MIKLALKYKCYLFFIIILMIIEPSINSILNFWLQKLFNSAIPGADKIYILRLLTTGFLFWILKRLITFFNSVLKARYICNTKQELKHQLFAKLFLSDISSIINTTASGDYISIFTNDISLIEQRFFNQVISLISGIISILILGSSFIALNAKLAISIFIVGFLAMLIPVVCSKELNRKNLAYSNMISKFTQNIKEYFTAYPTIKNYSVEQSIIQKFKTINKEVEDTKFEADYVLALANNMGSLLSWFMQFVGVGLGLMLVINGEILIGTVIASQSFASDLATPLQEIIINFNSIRSIKDIIKKLKNLSDFNGNSLDTSKEHPVLPSGVPQDISASHLNITEPCNITFDNLYLNIEENTIIDHFSFKFDSGKKYLIVGLNGSGKTSIFKALKKWIHNCSGTIFINDQDIMTMKNSDISKLVSYLNENVSLFSCSVKENISLFRKCTAESFENAVNNAQIHLDLERKIFDEGSNISSGERRRIEIARSLITSVPVLIFDEVVSTLDIETAYEIEKLALDFNKKTVIFISHNFSGKLIKKYDEILVMDKGRLIAHGSYNELIHSCEYFKKICEIKFGIHH